MEVGVKVVLDELYVKKMAVIDKFVCLQDLMKGEAQNEDTLQQLGTSSATVETDYLGGIIEIKLLYAIIEGFYEEMNKLKPVWSLEGLRRISSGN
uniref:Retrovirus-related Pol polyprotein from transposon TNT 1-94 n=1 Tax=Syphacia muris TaxID=451379 RepID=A0A0N5AH16_9BILA